MNTHPSSTAVFRVQDGGLTAADCTSVGCEIEAVLAEPGAVTAAALTGILALLAFAYVCDAKADCRDERRRVVAERDAFESFAERVAKMDPVPAEAAPGPSGRVGGVMWVGAAGRSGGDVALRRVLSAYRDAVMSLSHYRSEYDETVAESISAELGPDTATALATDGTLSAGAQSALVRRSRRAVGARERLAEAIDAELGELTEAESSLAGVDRRRRRLLGHLDGVNSGRTADAAIDVWRRLGELEGECDDLAADRQRSLDDPPMTLDGEADVDGRCPFYDYLYDSADGPRYPVLAQVTELADRLRGDRDRVGSQVAGGR